MTSAHYQANRLAESPDSLLGQISRIVTDYSEFEGIELHCAIRDTLTDLRHLCDIHGFDFGELDGDAHEGYIEELGAAHE